MAAWLTATKLPGTPQSGDVGAKLRLGGRSSFDEHDAFTYGLSYYRPLFGQDAGVPTDGTWKFGGYMGVQRHFANTPVMLFCWIEPVSYSYSNQNSNDQTNQQTTVVGYQFFQRGGFGMAYLF